MDIKTIRKFREYARKFDRIVNTQDYVNCCCGVTIPQCHIIMELGNGVKLTINELAKKLGLDKSTISRTVEGLVTVGLIDREIPKSDRRYSRVSLTIQGNNVYKTINKTNDKFWEKALESLPEKKQEDFVNLFKIFVEHLNKD
jgi:DNA-binding MarR family transcriptional regulator